MMSQITCPKCANNRVGVNGNGTLRKHRLPRMPWTIGKMEQCPWSGRTIEWVQFQLATQHYTTCQCTSCQSVRAYFMGESSLLNT
jgi:hypothetical protein